MFAKLMELIAKINPIKDKPEDNPFDLWGKECWELSGPKEFSSFFRALIGFLPEGSILCFESGPPRGKLKSFYLSNSIPERISIPKGTLWPRSEVYHVPATNENLTKLSEITEHYAEPEVAEHFHIYLDDYILIDWYDAFSDPMYVSKRIPEEKIATLCNFLSMTYKEHRGERNTLN